MRKFINIILRFYSHLPFLATTDDNNFGTIELSEADDDGNHSYRFSLISLNFGSRVFHFITYNLSKKKFCLFYKLELEKCEKLKDKGDAEKINNKTKEYKDEHVTQLNDVEGSIEKEFLRYLIDNQSSIINTSVNKINIYTAIILVMIPVAIAFFNIKMLYNVFEAVLLLLILYCILNIVIFVFDSIKVRGIQLSSFSELKKSKTKNIDIISSFYFDWQMLRDKSVIWVSYVKNIELWMKHVVFLLLVLLCTTNINNIIASQRALDIGSEKVVYSINISNLDNPFSTDNEQLTKIRLLIQSKKVNVLYIIGNTALPDEKIQDILKQFEVYESRIKIEYYSDSTIIDGNTIKIIGG